MHFQAPSFTAGLFVFSTPCTKPGAQKLGQCECQHGRTDDRKDLIHASLTSFDGIPAEDLKGQAQYAERKAHQNLDTKPDDLIEDRDKRRDKGGEDHVEEQKEQKHHNKLQPIELLIHHRRNERGDHIDRIGYHRNDGERVAALCPLEGKRDHSKIKKNRFLGYRAHRYGKKPLHSRSYVV